MKQAHRLWTVGCVSALLLLGGGCSRGTRIGDRKIRSPKVRTVSHYGVTLDKEASAKKVAFVLLRSLREDFLAPDQARREQALDVTFDVCAAGLLAASNQTSFTNDELTHQIVYHWAPVVGYYVGDLDFEWPQAEPRLVTAIAPPLKIGKQQYETTNVLIELADPSGDVRKQVVLVIKLARDQGYWRVFQLSYEQTRRHIARGA